MVNIGRGGDLLWVLLLGYYLGGEVGDKGVGDFRAGLCCRVIFRTLKREKRGRKIGNSRLFASNYHRITWFGALYETVN